MSEMCINFCHIKPCGPFHLTSPAMHVRLSYTGSSQWVILDGLSVFLLYPFAAWLSSIRVIQLNWNITNAKAMPSHNIRRDSHLWRLTMLKSGKPWPRSGHKFHDLLPPPTYIEAYDQIVRGWPLEFIQWSEEMQTQGEFKAHRVSTQRASGLVLLSTPPHQTRYMEFVFASTWPFRSVTLR